MWLILAAQIAAGLPHCAGGWQTLSGEPIDPERARVGEEIVCKELIGPPKPTPEAKKDSA